MQISRWGQIALLATIAMFAFPSVAAAGVATSEGGTVRFADPAGAGDDLTVTLRFVDDPSRTTYPQGWSTGFYGLLTPVTWGAGCEEGYVGTVCPYGASAPAGVAVDSGAGDDELDLIVTAEAAAAPTRITLAAGPGDDVIVSVRARAELDGGEGDDVVKPDERLALDFPPDATPGGVIRGGAGTDTVNYEQALNPIAVSLDGVANDGRPGERDNVHPDVENVTGSHYGNTLTGSSAANVLNGGGGEDRISGGSGRDTLDGRTGNDTIDALDAAPGDRITCGEGADVALVDSGDIVASDPFAACEQVAWAPRLARSTLRYRDGRITVTLACPTEAANCRGTVALRSAASKPRTLAKAGYRLKRGKRASLRLKPNRAGRSALKRRSVKATVHVAPRGASADAGRSITVRR